MWDVLLKKEEQLKGEVSNLEQALHDARVQLTLMEGLVAKIEYAAPAQRVGVTKKPVAKKLAVKKPMAVKRPGVPLMKAIREVVREHDGWISSEEVAEKLKSRGNVRLPITKRPLLTSVATRMCQMSKAKIKGYSFKKRMYGDGYNMSYIGEGRSVAALAEGRVVVGR